MLDIDGSPIPLDELARRRQASLDASSPEATIDDLRVMQFTCADGTGSFTVVVEERNGVWTVREGTGAYETMTGSGSMEIERDPPADAQEPSGGLPRYDHLKGVIGVLE